MNKKVKLILFTLLPALMIMIPAIFLSKSLPELFNKRRSSYHKLQAGWLTIDPQGRPWLAHNEKLSTGETDSLIILDVLNGESWTTHRQGASVRPVSGIRALASDLQGNIWIGTWKSGLVRFDGRNWTSFTTKNSGLANYMIKDISVDHQGRIWIAYHSAPSPKVPAYGVTVYDGKKWTTFTKENSGLASNEVYTVAFDAQDRAWIGTAQGVSLYDGLKWTSYSPANSGMRGERIAAIAFDEEDRAWMITWGEVEGVNVFDGEQWKFYSPREMGYGSFSSWGIPDIYVDKFQRIWVYSTGTRIFDGDKWIKLPEATGGGINVRSVASDGQGRTWINDGKGFYSLAPEYPLALVARTQWLRLFFSSGGLWYLVLILVCMMLAIIFDTLPSISLSLLVGFAVTLVFGPFIKYPGPILNPGVLATVGGVIGAFVGKNISVRAKNPKKTRWTATIIGLLIGSVIGICLLLPYLLIE